MGVILAYLHGSVATNTERNDSDVDIAVLFDKSPQDPIEATALVGQTFHGFVPQREIDVAILNDASPLLKQAVASRGIVLYERSSDDALRFQMRAMHEYEYSRHVVRMGQELILERAQV